MSLGERARGLLDLCRPLNAVLSGVLTLIGAYVAGRPFAGAALVAALATVFAVAAGNAINDYFDREIDRINAPERPIPRGAVSPRGALAFSVALFAVAVVFALSLPVVAVAIAAVNLVALVAYTKLFKGLPGAGNAVVAYLGGSTFLFGAAAVGRPLAGAVLALLAALSTFAREVVKDVEDVAGDREEGLNTLPIAVGERPALLVAAGVLALAVLASPLPYVTDLFGVAYLAVVVPADAVMAYAAYLAFSDPTRAQGLLKYGMVLAAAAFVVGRAFA
ncbi:geranylgeranylglycerol-phosphate geranylgeranyltransferase [Halarchaeum sp. CBA1220]|uniref:geranylgeranylglycerol-phosphate geranylgeranyltransferase n=1 Tax=Halarchaeum sp. CBA1220 TaxID=1853682 RepID=UPI000F3A8EF9|nr:geranylgeranylglycerol-phosphate geranylgeranyltransferase [Halarchaeum sp. CBA1220]QLC34031.1 geranylgeranylglycerol-phosphate geranylgeranyltransferase [Halarchaeum sp. CBA1220]